MSNSLWNVKAVADYLCISVFTVYRYAEKKELPHIKKKFGLRFRKEDIDEFLEKDKRKNIPLSDFPQDRLTVPSASLMYNGGICEVAKRSKSKTRFYFGYGAIYQRKLKNGKTRWYMDYRDVNNKRIQRVAKKAQSKEEALIELQEEVAKEFNKEYGKKRKREKITFRDFSKIYFERYGKKKRSWERSDKSYLRANLIPYFGHLLLSEIDSFLIENYISKRIEDGVKESTINRELACLRKMFNKAIDWEFVTENPISKVEFFSEKDNLKERILTEEEEDRLLDTSSEHLQPILIVALNTGMRLGEILNLEWRQINLDAQKIRVEKTKSGKIRFIEINTFLLQEFLKLRSKSGNGQFVFPNPETRRPYRDIKKAFKGACKRTGINGLRFHDLRHTFATRLIEKGVDLITIKDLLGHSTVKITERYTHSNREQKRRAVELLTKIKQEKAATQDDLWRQGDMGKKEEKAKVLSSFFSVN